jgi:hypothetical protein
MRTFKTVSLEKIANTGSGRLRIGHVEEWTYKHATEENALRSLRRLLEKVWGENWIDWKKLP